MSTLRVQHISKRAVKAILTSLESRRDIDRAFVDMLKEYEEVKVFLSQKFEIVVFNNIVALFKTSKLEFYMPTLYIVNTLYNTKRMLVVPSIVVDEGAVEPIKRGADVMMPGIRRVVKGFSKGDIVAVMEPEERYFIAIGIALVDSTHIAPGVKGRGIENVAHIDDEIWSASLQIARSLSRWGGSV